MKIEIPTWKKRTGALKRRVCHYGLYYSFTVSVVIKKIEIQNNFYYNLVSSCSIFQVLENYVLDESKKGITSNTFLEICYHIQDDDSQVTWLGCEKENYKEHFTEKIVWFYLVICMHFLCNFINKNQKSKVEAKLLKKMSKLKTGSEIKINWIHSLYVYFVIRNW